MFDGLNMIIVSSSTTLIGEMSLNLLNPFRREVFSGCVKDAWRQIDHVLVELILKLWNLISWRNLWSTTVVLASL